MIPKTKFEQLSEKWTKREKGFKLVTECDFGTAYSQPGLSQRSNGKSFSAADHSKRRTTQPKDINLIRQISKK